MPPLSPREWLRNSRPGFCAITCASDNRDPYHRCDHGDKGSIPLKKTSSWATAAKECLAHCGKCFRCRFISVSMQFADCSWFYDCPTRQQIVPSFLSAAAWSHIAFTTNTSASAVSPKHEPATKTDYPPLQRDSRPCFAALGVMSAPGMHARRQLSRATWLQQSSPGVVVRFLIRSSSLQGAGARGSTMPYTRGDVQRVSREKARYDDILVLNVSAGPDLPAEAVPADILRGRVQTLQAWLRVARLHFPTARFIAKADDDVYMMLPKWSEHLRWITDHTRPDAPLIVGRFVWHAWEVSTMLPKTFSFSYDPVTTWRAVRYSETNGASAAGLPHGVRASLAACFDGREVVRHGCVPNLTCATGLQRCNYCTRRDDCVGPFPFPAGWLITMTSSLVDLLLSDILFLAEETRIRNLMRSWGQTVFEDIWLGSLLHRMSPSNVSFVHEEEAVHFNGKTGSHEEPLECLELSPEAFLFHHSDLGQVHSRVTKSPAFYARQDHNLACLYSDRVGRLEQATHTYANEVARAAWPAYFAERYQQAHQPIVQTVERPHKAMGVCLLTTRKPFLE